MAEAAIGEATPMCSHVESRIATLAENVEETTSHAIGENSQRLEHELETVALGTIAVSTQNTRTAIEG